jgi:hypothetical protein
MRWLLLVALAGCAPHYEWVEEPQPPETPREREAHERPPTATTGPCAASTPAVRQQARQGRFQGVEGFDARGCVGPEPWSDR